MHEAFQSFFDICLSSDLRYLLDQLCNVLKWTETKLMHALKYECETQALTPTQRKSLRI